MSRQDKLHPPQSENCGPSPIVDEDQLQIDLRHKLDEVTAVVAKHLQASARRRPSRNELIGLASKIYDARRKRDRMLDKQQAGLFGEPAWDMLLALYCLPPRGHLLSISGLSYAAYVPQTTGLRWQRILTREGLVETGPDLVDMRRRFVRLTPRGKSLMETYLTRLYNIGTPVPTVPD